MAEKQVSSGAEKARALTNNEKDISANTKSREKAEKTRSSGHSKGVNAQVGTKTHPQKAQKNQKTAAKQRRAKSTKIAKTKGGNKKSTKEERAQRLANIKHERAERKAERNAERSAARAAKNEARREKREARAAERAAKREERAAKREARVAERSARREHELRLREQRRKDRREKSRGGGIGGWLAAVISLGVTTLALGTTLTYGWISMNGIKAQMADINMRSIYELNSVVDGLENNLSKARVASSTGDRVRVLTEIAAESETAETLIERLPLEGQVTQKLTAFVNNMGAEAKRMVYTAATRGELTGEQKKQLEWLYETNTKLKTQLNEMISKGWEGDMSKLLTGEKGLLAEGFDAINSKALGDEIYEGPFATHKEHTNKRAFIGKEISASQAEERAQKLLEGYNVQSVRCTGEAMARQAAMYNLSVITPDGEMLVQMSKHGGRIVMFDSFKDCSQHNFSVDRCEKIAQDFLEKLGYKDMKAVWVSENETTCNINFVPTYGEVIAYPDIVKVKVCEERGLVTGMEAIAYCLNHGEREIAQPTISAESAKGAVDGRIEVKSCRLALIPLGGEEVLCYEFCGNLGESEYFVYVDAKTGEEVQVLTVVGTKTGRAIV